ncbi:hypothetical protein [Rhodococcus maanshanensis]|uniref:Uncharacterized protein n=1 Tax=Rhodococcus maanshanensis TaxID=183556 RepID=A0A1H7HT07_9NOCA|nr:hypothetical protein [Rhodococcus maanshanensis]SEK53298.1 hypothetical protein SAMN05444583_102214 [Rhodococcus maanshanensis]
MTAPLPFTETMSATAPRPSRRSRRHQQPTPRHHDRVRQPFGVPRRRAF